MSDPWRARYQPRNDRAGGTAGEYEQQEQRIREKSARIRHKILVLSGKGGVGKSTVAANLAWALALRGSRTGLLDADINGPTIPLLMGLAGQRFRVLEPVAVLEQLQVMSIAFLLDDPDSPTIWRGPLKGGVIRQFIADVEWGPLDYLVVDLPPGTGDEPLTVGQMFPDADGGVIVTTPQEASLSVCRKAINFLHALKLPVLGVIENMSGFVCPHCGKHTEIFKTGGGEAMAREMGVPFLGAVPLDPQVTIGGDAGKPVAACGHHGETGKAFGRIVRKLLEPELSRDVPIAQKEGESMKIAVPVAEGRLCQHFGHCKQFALFEVDQAKKKILGKEMLTPPPHEPGVLPRWLAGLGADMIITGGMGARAQSLFSEGGVKVLVGAPSDEPEKVVKAYLEGTLKAGANVCDH